MVSPKRTPTALLIPSPWSGAESDKIPGTYWWWFRLYCAVRVTRHRLGVHDWAPQRPPEGGSQWRSHCDWCGASKATT